MRASLVSALLAFASSSIGALIAPAAIAYAKPVPEAFPANLPDVTRVQDDLDAMSGLVARDKGAKVVAITADGIRVDGVLVVAITNGAVARVDKEAGAMGMTIPTLAAALAGSEPVEIGMDRDLTFRLLVEAIDSAKHSGRTKIALLVRVGGAVVAAPIVVPTAAPLAMAIDEIGDATKASPITEQLGIVITASTKEVLMWSMSGKEGRLTKPSVTYVLHPEVRELSRTTAAVQARAHLETVAMRWKGKPRPPATQAVVLMSDGANEMQFVAELLVAMRPYFSDVRLTTGFH